MSDSGLKMETLGDIITAYLGKMAESNPTEVSGGVDISALTKLITQGSGLNPGRSLKVVIEGDVYLLAPKGANSGLSPPQKGEFFMDKNFYLVDSLGKRMLGYPIDRETQVPGAQVAEIHIDHSALLPKASTTVHLTGNLDATAKVEERCAGVDSKAWQLFSAGEDFASMPIATVGGPGLVTVYGDGYYQDNILYQDAGASYQACSPREVTLAACSKNLVEGFRLGDVVSVLEGPHQVQRTICGVNTATRALTLSSPLPAGFTTGSLTVTNLDRGSTSRGTSGVTGVHNDVLKSQIAVVDGNGRLLANFYRVASKPRKYTDAAAKLSDGGFISVGTGEFTDIRELRDLIENVLRDNHLSHYSPSSDLRVSLDEYGAMSFGGSGMVQNFRFIMNADNKEMLDRFSGIAMTEAAAGGSQALLDSKGQVVANPELGLGNRTVHESKAWYSSSGLENDAYSAAHPGTAYGEYAGLRLSHGAKNPEFAELELSMINGLGERVTQEFRLVSEGADPARNEFSSMGDLKELLLATLRSARFSTRAIDGVLVADETALASFTEGRLNISTVLGAFNNLQITSRNPSEGASRTDQDSFVSVLGELNTGVSGKSGTSNKFIEPDLSLQTRVCDSGGKEHMLVTHFVKDRTSALTNTEWKFEASLSPSLGIHPETPCIPGGTCHSSGTLAFDSLTDKILDPSSPGSEKRYSNSARLVFPSSTDSQEANASSVALDFTMMTSRRGPSTVEGLSDGHSAGRLLGLRREAETGNINGLYSNGLVLHLAKV